MRILLKRECRRRTIIVDTSYVVDGLLCKLCLRKQIRKSLWRKICGLFSNGTFYIHATWIHYTYGLLLCASPLSVSNFYSHYAIPHAIWRRVIACMNEFIIPLLMTCHCGHVINNLPFNFLYISPSLYYLHFSLFNIRHSLLNPTHTLWKCFIACTIHTFVSFLPLSLSELLHLTHARWNVSLLVP